MLVAPLEKMKEGRWKREAVPRHLSAGEICVYEYVYEYGIPR
jgi:hypothetical protein